LYSRTLALVDEDQLGADLFDFVVIINVNPIGARSSGDSNEVPAYMYRLDVVGVGSNLFTKLEPLPR